MTRVLAACVCALAFTSPAGAISPGDETAILNDLHVSYAPGLHQPGSAWRIARYVRVHQPAEATIESLTLYPSVIELAFANPDLKLTPQGATAFQPAWLIRTGSVRKCSLLDARVCSVGTAWTVVTDPAFEFVESGSS